MTGRFYESNLDEDVYITTHRAVLYTNYKLFREPIETGFGKIQESANLDEIKTVIYEGQERLPKQDKSPHTGEVKPAFLVSVGSDSIVNDFSFLASFVLRASFSTDRDLIYSLTKSKRPSPNVIRPMREYVNRYFDDDVVYSVNDQTMFSDFVQNLLCLQREKFESVMRSIRRFVTGIQRMGDDLDLSYTLLVASIESLAQNYDSFNPSWESLDQAKRHDLDKTLRRIGTASAEEIRAKLLKYEHLALSRRFREFTMAAIKPEFYRSDAIGRLSPMREIDLEAALKNAYTLRSKYVHELQEIPRIMKSAPGHSEIWHIDNRPVLSFEGLIRIAHYVIMHYVNSSEKVETEDYRWNESLPNTIQAQMAAEYWVWQHSWYNHKTSNQHLNGYLEILTDVMLGNRDSFVNMEKVCETIERIALTLSKENRRSMILTYWLYHTFLNPKFHRPKADEFLSQFTDELDFPSIQSLLANVLTGQTSDWEPEESEEIWRHYINQRNTKNGIRATQIIETAICIHTAKIHDSLHNEDERGKWISRAIESDPGNSKLIEIEKILGEGAVLNLVWQEILLPKKEKETTAPTSIN